MISEKPRGTGTRNRFVHDNGTRHSVKITSHKREKATGRFKDKSREEGANLEALNDAAAPDFVTVVKNGGLSGAQSPLGFVELDAKAGGI